jgi:hypothetical protein
MLSNVPELLVKRGTGIYKHMSNGSLHDLVFPIPLCQSHPCSYSLQIVDLCLSYLSLSRKSIRPIMSSNKGGYVKAKRVFNQLSRQHIGRWPEDEPKWLWAWPRDEREWLWDPLTHEVNNIAEDILAPTVEQIEGTFCKDEQTASDLAEVKEMALRYITEPIMTAERVHQNCRRVVRMAEKSLEDHHPSIKLDGTETRRVIVSQGAPSRTVIRGREVVEVSTEVGFTVERITRNGDAADQYGYLRCVRYILSIEPEHPGLKRNVTRSNASVSSARTSQGSSFQESIWTSSDNNNVVNLLSCGHGDASCKPQFDKWIGKIVGSSSSSLPPGSTLENPSTL